MKHHVKVLIVGTCVGLSGCATMVNPGRIHTVMPKDGGPAVKVGRVELENTPLILVFDESGGRQTGGLAVFDGPRRLDIQDAADNRYRLRYCGTLTGGDTVCAHRVLLPYVELDRSVPHTLRLVSNDAEATVTVKPRMHWQWIWLNGIWGVAMPIGWAMDAASGRWQYFGRLNVAAAFLQASRTSTSNRAGSR